MATVFILGMICALIVAILMGFELKWSINNLRELMDCSWPMRILKIPFIPFCFLPLIWDVAITVILINVMGMTGGILGLTATMVCASVVGVVLFYCRRKYHWRFA